MLVTLCFAQAQAADINSIKATIAKHAIEMGVDPAIALSIARTESGFNHNARSSHGAVGVFQLMPSTARRMGINPYSLNENIKGGIMYYKSMYKMFGSVELALAAYNAGPGNVKRYNNSIPPYAETRRFVSKIMTDYHYYKKNSDPAIKAAKASVAAAKKPAVPANTVAQVKPVEKIISPAPELVKAVEVNAVKVEVIDETPIDLEIEAKSLAI